MSGERGFTIVEMVIVVVIAGVLAALAAPNLSELVKNNTRATRINSLVTAFNVARSEAVKLNAEVTVCASANGTSCNDPAGGEFEDGWIVFVESNAAGTRGVVDAGETVLRSWVPGMNADGDRDTPPNLRGLDGVAGGAVNAFTYLGSGFPPPNTPAATHVVYCDDRGISSVRAIGFSTTGQPRMARDGSDSGDTPEIQGTNVQCSP